MFDRNAIQVDKGTIDPLKAHNLIILKHRALMRLVLMMV